MSPRMLSLRDRIVPWVGPVLTVVFAISSALVVAVSASVHVATEMDKRVTLIETIRPTNVDLDRRLIIQEQGVLRYQDFQDRVLEWQRKTDTCIEHIKESLSAIHVAVARLDPDRPKRP